jgi:hypothetical protein
MSLARSLILVLTGLLLICAMGCGSKTELNTEYGKISNQGQTASINGTRALAEMFRQQGLTVSRQLAISPRLHRFQTIIWFPDRRQVPSQEVVDALEEWLDEGYSRTLIYVGRDYEATLNYLEQVRDKTEIENQEEFFRLIAEARVAELKVEEDVNQIVSAQQCDWFEQKPASRRKPAKRIRGDLTKGVSAQRVYIEAGDLLLPPKDAEVEKLLVVDGQPFVYSIPSFEFSRNQVIVVSNASFLLNYGLTHAENRKLAGNLIRYCDPAGGVVFLESGPGEIPIRTSSDASQPWAWISRPPLRYIVPHVFVWGVLFCFVFFPIYGKAKRFLRKPASNRTVQDTASARTSESASAGIHYHTSTTSFRSHIVALGKLLQRSESRSDAITKIRNYQETFGKESTFK